MVFRLPRGESMTFAQLAERYPEELGGSASEMNPEESWGSLLAHVRGLSLLPVNVAGYLSGSYQLQSEDGAVIDLLKGDPPWLE